jgi:hypothetical protein
MTTTWADMKPGHFDTSRLPRTRKPPAGQGELFNLADIAPDARPAPPTPAPELDGQGDLLDGL